MDLEINEMRKDFNRDNPEYRAPGISNGTHECELVWQWQNPYSEQKKWEFEESESSHDHSLT